MRSLQKIDSQTVELRVIRKNLIAQVSSNVPGSVHLSQCSFELKTHLTLQRDAY